MTAVLEAKNLGVGDRLQKALHEAVVRLGHVRWLGGQQHERRNPCRRDCGPEVAGLLVRERVQRGTTRRRVDPQLDTALVRLANCFS